MAWLNGPCTFVRKFKCVRKLLVFFLLAGLVCVVVIIWTESYVGYGSLSYIPNDEHTTTEFFTVIQSLDQQIYGLSVEGKLLQAVDKLPFKVMTPSSLLLEDLYFTPSTNTLVQYRNQVVQQPQFRCTGDELMLILVPSHPGSVRERRAIRETWGMVARGRAWPGKGNNYPVKLVFVLGVNDPIPLPENVMDKARPENETFGNNRNPFPDKNIKTRINSQKYNQTLSYILKTKVESDNNQFKSPYNERYDHFNKPIHEQATRNHITRRESESKLKINGLSAEATTDRLTFDSRLKPLQHIQHTSNTVTSPNVFSTEPDLIPEISSFDDILQFDMIDSYANLTRKIILSLRWSVKLCPTAKYILKVDPDVFVNVPLLTTFLKRYGETNSIYGHIYPNSWVERQGKWAVSKLALPIPKYPIYAAGNAYVVSKDAAEKIIKLAPLFPYVLVEDAFITGVLASVGGVNRVFVGGFTKWTESRPHPCDFVRGKKYVGNNFTDYDHRVFWREIIDNEVSSCDK